MKKSILAIGLTATIAFSGCAQLSEFVSEVKVADRVKLQEVSILNGITILINDVPCRFSFTSDKYAILQEVKTCMGNQLIRPALLVGSSTGSEPEPSVDEKVAEDITEEILKTIQQ